MGRISFTSALIGGVASFSHVANADRACNSNTTSYLWRIGDARFDGVGSNNDAGKAVVAISIVPNGINSFFECVAEWPEPWAGRSPDAEENIIWSDCIWSGAGPTLDKTIAFALDWKDYTMYLSHTFSCSDKNGSTSVSAGSVKLDLDCSNGNGNEDDAAHCTLKSNTTNSPTLQVRTTPITPRLPVNATCRDNTAAYQSWQLESWLRQYELAPGVLTDTAVPQNDSGPSFILRNLANGDVFDCTPAETDKEGDGDQFFNGTCTLAARSTSVLAASITSASFRFDPTLNILTVTQRWECDSESSFEVSGVAYVQATCSRQGTILTCTSLPLWIGTRTIM